MPPAAVGAAFVAAGVTATAATVTAVVTAVYIGAAIGAVVGAATALVTGGDVLKGAISGAVIGGITSGIGSAFGGGAAAATTVGEVGVETVGVESVLAAEDAAAGAALTSSASDAGVASGVTQTVTPTVTPTPKPTSSDGILSGVGNWANNNPTQASVIVDALGGVASSMYESSTKQEELEAEMERDQLNIDALKIKGLTNTDLKTSLPSIATFTEEPAWTIPSTGIIWGGMSNA